jgi:signal transduction histidine kinase
VEALRNHLAIFAESSSVSAPLEIEGEVRPLPPELAHAAFRIIQEALTNVEKHAQAGEVKVTLHFGAGGLACTVKDDGVGFDPASLPGAGMESSLGLPGMTQRAQSVGGTIRVSSAPGQGTQVEFAVPLSERTGATPKGP